MDTLLYYTNIYLVPMIVVAVLYFNIKNQVRNLMGRKYFRAVLFCVEMGTLFLIISWAPGDTVPGRWCIGAGTVICMSFAVAAGYAWLVYIFCLVKQREDLKPYKRVLIPAGLPVVIYTVILATSPWHGLIFSIDAAGNYVRGPLSWVPYIVTAGYLICSSIMALAAAKREILPDRKREYRNNVVFLMLPIIGLLIQSRYYLYPAVIPCTALAMFIIYLNMVKGYSSLDPLTGLNNRRQFNRYLSARFASPGKDRWCLIMLDLDGFKEINDVLGHTVGDQALVYMAQQLKYTFRDGKSFVARYGGDEFVVMAPCNTEVELLDILTELAQNINEFNERRDIPFMLLYSVGCAIYGRAIASPEELLHLADEHMYQSKKTHREAPVSSIKERRSI